MIIKLNETYYHEKLGAVTTVGFNFGALVVRIRDGREQEVNRKELSK